MAQGDLYTFSSGLQDILTRRKAEEQQALVNAMKQKELDADIAYKKSYMDSMEEQRQAMAAQREQATVANWLKGFQMGDDLSGADPEMLALAQKYNYLTPENPNPTPQVSTGTSIEGVGTPEGDQTIQESLVQPEATPPKQGKFFRGLPEQREQQRQMAAMGQLIQSGVLTDQNMSPIERMLMLQQVSGKMDTGDMARIISEQASERPMIMVGPDKKPVPLTYPGTNKPVTTRGGNPVVEFGYAPNPPAATQPYLHQIPVPGKPGEYTSHWLRPGEQPSEANMLRMDGSPINGARRGNAPNPTQRNLPQLFTPEQSRRLADLKSAADSAWGPSKDRAEQAYTNYIHTTIPALVNRVSDPSVIASIMAIMNDERFDGMSVDDIMATARQDKGASPRELLEMESILRAVLE